MEVSNVQKYTIKHVKDNGNPIEIPVYPSSVVPSHNLISKSWNNMYGVFNCVPVNIKAKVNWIFDCMSEEEVRKLYKELIYDKINLYHNIFFEINTYFPGFGFVKGTFYLGTPTNYKSLGAKDNKGSIEYFSGEIHWIEVDGKILNSPAQA